MTLTQNGHSKLKLHSISLNLQFSTYLSSRKLQSNYLNKFQSKLKVTAYFNMRKVSANKS